MDLSNHLSDPYCAILLGDHGADVIKVERPDGGDDARAVPLIGASDPHFATNADRVRNNEARVQIVHGRLLAATVGTLAERPQEGRHPVRRRSEF